MAFPYHKTHIFRLLRSCWPVAIPISSGGRVGAALVIPGGLLFRLSLARVCVRAWGSGSVKCEEICWQKRFCNSRSRSKWLSCLQIRQYWRTCRNILKDSELKADTLTHHCQNRFVRCRSWLQNEPFCQKTVSETCLLALRNGPYCALIWHISQCGTRRFAVRCVRITPTCRGCFCCFTTLFPMFHEC